MVRCRVRLGLENVPQKIDGSSKAFLTVPIEANLVVAISSVVDFVCAKQKKMPNKKALIAVVSSCLGEDPTSL